MKKTVTILAVLTVITLNATAQKSKTTSNKKFSWGLQLGYWASSAITVKGTSSKTFDAASKAMFGVFTNFKVNNNFSIEPQLNYGTEGSKFEVYPFKLSYLNIPVLAKYTFNNSAISVMAGPQIGFKTKAEGNSAITYLDDKGNKVEPTTLIKSTQVAGVFGANYQFNFGINVGLRYQMGLSNIYNSSGANIKSNLLGVTVGYTF